MKMTIIGESETSVRESPGSTSARSYHPDLLYKLELGRTDAALFRHRVPAAHTPAVPAARAVLPVRNTPPFRPPVPSAQAVGTPTVLPVRSAGTLSDPDRRPIPTAAAGAPSALLGGTRDHIISHPFPDRLGRAVRRPIGGLAGRGLDPVVVVRGRPIPCVRCGRMAERHPVGMACRCYQPPAPWWLKLTNKLLHPFSR